MNEHEDPVVKKKVLKDLLPYLRQTLGDPCRYIPYLVEGNVLDTREIDAIKSKTTSKEKLEIFLHLLIKDGEDVSAFDVFVSALEDLGVQNQIARKLRRTLAYEKQAMQNIDSAGKIVVLMGKGYLSHSFCTIICNHCQNENQWSNYHS